MGGASYSASFYAGLRKGAGQSAEIIVPLVLELVRIRSVLDLGCGDGTWLAVFRKHGVEDVLGLDGEYVDRSILQIPVERFQAFDLTTPFHPMRPFDLAVSLEVAEHLPAEFARIFVESLARSAPLILFSAAIPFQGGANHVNEQWPEKWAELFKEHDFAPIDFIRKQVWRNELVEWWYAQNTLLFAHKNLIETSPRLRAEFEGTNPAELRLVHPRQFLDLRNRYLEAVMRAEYPPPPSGLREASKLLLTCLRNSLKARLDSIRGKRSPATKDTGVVAAGSKD